MIKQLTGLALTAFCASSIAQITPEWVRYPAISPDASKIAFTYKGNIYSVDVNGGQATQLTFHKAHDFKPVWSKDSQRLAFASDRHGNFDVFVMDAEGGQATRLTYHSSNEEPYTFTNDDTEVYFKGLRMDAASNRVFPSGGLAELYSVPVDGGAIKQILTTPAEEVQFNASGDKFLYIDHQGTENPWRKHHRSAVTRDIWEYDAQSGDHKQLTKFEGEDRNPVYSADGKSYYYLSESKGSFNVHKSSLKRPTSSKKLTDFELHPVRFLSAAQDKLAFTHHGTLYTMQDGEKPTPVSISIRTQDIVNSQEMVGVNGEISEFSISPDGKEIAYISRGDVFVSSVDGAFTKQITSTPAKEADVSFSPEGDYLIYASERDAKWSVYKAQKKREQEPFFYAASLINESVFLSNEKDNYQPKLSPDGKKLAFVEDRRTISVLDLDSQKTVNLVMPQETIHFRDGDQTFSWSPDSQWIMFEYGKLLNNSDIALIKADGTAQKKVIVPSGYYDASPKWVNDGKQIIWFSNAEGLKSYATSGRAQYDVYSLFFTQEEWDKFNMSEDDFKLMQAIEEKLETQKEASETADDKDKASDEADKNKDEDDEAVELLTFDWDDLDRRIAKLTIHSSSLSDAVLNKKADTLYYLSEFEDGYDLWETNLRTQETKKLISMNGRSGSLAWDPEMENLYFLSGGSLSKLDLDKGAKSGISINADMLVDYDAIRLEAFEHVWLRTSKVFYEPTYHGIDWQQMRNEYLPKVSHTSNPHEFTELLAEMLGELNVSHSGAGYRGTGEGDATASLGIFYDYDYSGDGIKITEIINDGPLDKAKFDIEAGMIITAIDGTPINDAMDWASLLNRKANKFVLLDIASANGEVKKQITVKPISLRDESRLLYDRFVKRNEAQVLKDSKGKLGYVHIPSMGDGPFRNIYDDMMGRFYDKKGMVVDARNNRGGDLVADLAMFFTGEAFLTYATEDRVVGGEPTSRYTKPIVSLFNEAMYSDGHCYASGYQDLKLGKSVGMPVPGTCSFAGWEGLPNGGYWGIVPVSAKNKAGEWLENNQTSPDIIIKNMPKETANGRDEQLERAIKTLLKETR